MIGKKFLPGLSAQRKEDRRAELYRSLIRHEAKIGGELFGPLAKGQRREFFCLDRRTWVWHEEWVDSKGKRQIRTTRYDIRPDTILKAQNGRYQELTDDEALHFVQAVNMYADRVHKELYSFA